MTQLLSHRPRDLHVTFFASVIILISHCTCGCLFFACRQVPCFIYSPFSVSLPYVFLLSTRFVDFSEIPPLYANNTFLPDLRRAARSRLPSPSVFSCRSCFASLSQPHLLSKTQHEDHEVSSLRRHKWRWYPQAGSDAHRPRRRHGYGSTWCTGRKAWPRRYRTTKCIWPAPGA